MVPTTILDQSTTIHTVINTASLSNQSVSTRSNDSHGFGVYQLTTIGASEATIRTLVPVPISAPLYCKALIAKIFHQIFGHAVSLSILISDLVSTVATFVSESVTRKKIFL